MISAQNKIIHSFLSDVIEDETCKTISLISSADSSELVKFLEKKNLEQLFILPQIDNNLNIQSIKVVGESDVECSYPYTLDNDDWKTIQMNTLREGYESRSLR